MLKSPFQNAIAFCALSEAPANEYLLPEEACIVGNWKAAARISEFTMGRIAAHKAIKNLGQKDLQPILRGERGYPIWPNGIIGSIAHTKGMAVAAVGQSGQFAAIGIDIENRSRVIKEDISSVICTQKEFEDIREKRAPDVLSLFCAKEAFYKAFFPLTKIFVGFSDVEFEWNSNLMSYIPHVLKKIPDFEYSLEGVPVRISEEGPFLLASLSLKR